MRADDLFWLNDRHQFASVPEADPLTEEDALDEAGLVGLRYDAFRQSVGLLIDLRAALHYRLGNVAVLIVRDASNVNARRTNDAATSMPHYWHTTFGPRITTQDGRFRLHLEMLSGLVVDLDGGAVEFYVGTMPALPDRPPDLGQDDVVKINDGFPRWDMEFIPEHATFTDHW